MIPHHRFDGREDGPVLVLSSSLGANLSMWEPQLPALTERFRVLRYDHRGHGGSDVPPGPYTIDDFGRDAVELLDAAGLERVAFCGLSLGGAVALWLGINAPERVSQIGVCCSAAKFGTAEIWQERADATRASGSVEPLVDAVLARWFTESYRDAHPGTMAQVSKMLVGTPAEGYAASCEALRDCDLRPELGRIATPTLVVSAAADPATPPEQGEAVAAAIPGARFVLVPDSAHFANWEQTEAFDAALLGFFSP